MWTDHETERDFLNFSGVAATVAEVIRQAHPQPVSVGVSGAWGVGKSSMIKLIRNELVIRKSAPQGVLDVKNSYVFVDFNAWLYQGYDDARAALLDIVASSLTKEAESRQKGTEKAWEFLERVNGLRVAQIASSAAMTVAAAHPVVAFAGSIVGAAAKILAGSGEKEAASGEPIAAKSDGEQPLLRPKKHESPPQEIQALRESFQKVLEAMEVTLVVLIDDLDRCLPETAVSTLEAIRLLLFLPHTAFVIAADEAMIKHAVRKHFEGVEDSLVTSYFDKLIQVPIRVPQLGVQEVRAYLMLLYIEDSNLDGSQKEELRRKICEQLGRSWQGKRVDFAYVRSLGLQLPAALVGRLDTADRLAPMMAKSVGISGNPRLIKRFLNATAIRMSLSRGQGIGVDESVLTKLMIFERCGNPKSYDLILRAVSESQEGKPAFLKQWEQDVREGRVPTMPAPWDPTFTPDWLKLDPPLGDLDLRGALYVSREYAPLLLSEDRLSSASIDVLNALLAQPEMAMTFKEQLASFAPEERAIFADKILEKARLEQVWGAPPILEAAIAVAVADAVQADRLAGFLAGLPAKQIQASIVPKIDAYSWAKSVIEGWRSHPEIHKNVKKAIEIRSGNGNLAIK